MKIIQITPTLNFGGAETMCENLSCALSKLGHDVIVVSLYNIQTAISERLQKAGIRVVFLDKKSGLDLSMINKLKKLFITEKPDVVHSHNNSMQYVVPAAKRAHIKNRVHTVHSVASKELSKLSRIAARIFYKFYQVKPVALSAIIRDTVVDEYNLPASKIAVIFNGIDLSKCEIKKDYTANDTFTILHVGRFANEKNHAMLISAFKKIHDKHPNCKLQLIGDGELRDSIENMIKDKSLIDCVELLGIQSNVFPYMNKADIFVLPSLYEGIPLTVAEAMGTGMPIVATKVGGIPDMVENEVSALLVEVEEHAISEAIERLYSNFDLRQRIGKEANKSSENFSAEIMAKRYLSVYNS